MDTAKPQNPCTDLSEIRRWGAEGCEVLRYLFLCQRCQGALMKKITETRIKKGKKEG